MIDRQCAFHYYFRLKNRCAKKKKFRANGLLLNIFLAKFTCYQCIDEAINTWRFAKVIAGLPPYLIVESTRI